MGKTIVWQKNVEEDEQGKEIITYTVKAKEIIRETEKAVYVNLLYWRHGSGNYISFKEYAGHKVWIPKSAIIEIEEERCAV